MTRHKQLISEQIYLIKNIATLRFKYFRNPEQIIDQNSKKTTRHQSLILNNFWSICNTTSDFSLWSEAMERLYRNVLFSNDPNDPQFGSGQKLPNRSKNWVLHTDYRILTSKSMVTKLLKTYPLLFEGINARYWPYKGLRVQGVPQRTLPSEKILFEI